MGQAQINVRTRACSGTFIARTKQAALTYNVRGKRLNKTAAAGFLSSTTQAKVSINTSLNNSASTVRCHSLQCIWSYYDIAWLGSRSNSNIRNSAFVNGQLVQAN